MIEMSPTGESTKVLSAPSMAREVVAKTPTLADVLAELQVPADRILLRPMPGTATVEDVIAVRGRERTLCELVDGVLVMKAMGSFESNLACVLIQILKKFLDQLGLGVIAGEGGMIRLAPGLVRIPDVSFVSIDPFPGGRVGREPVPSLIPTIAVEVQSESNTKAEMDRKLLEHFTVGSKMVWHLNPVERTVRVYKSPENFVTLDESQTLDGGEDLPGFLLPIREWFERAKRPFGAIPPRADLTYTPPNADLHPAQSARGSAGH